MGLWGFGALGGGPWGLSLGQRGASGASGAQRSMSMSISIVNGGHSGFSGCLKNARGEKKGQGDAEGETFMREKREAVWCPRWNS